MNRNNEVNTDSPDDPLGLFKEQFLALRDRWRAVRAETGMLLLQAESQVGNLMKALRVWVRDELAISECEQVVCMRIAKGEMEADLCMVIPPSKLAKMSNQNMPKMDQEYTIYSANDGMRVTKRLRDFNKIDVQTCINQHGVINFEEAVAQKEKPFSSCIARHYRIEHGSLILTVNSLKKDVKIRVTPELISDIIHMGNKEAVA